MSKAFWIFTLCVVITNVIPVSAASKLPVSPWSSLITIPKLPTVPSLKELNLAIRGLTSPQKSIMSDLERLDTITSEIKDENNCIDCEDEIVELEAEEFNAEDETTDKDDHVKEMTFENEHNNNTEHTSKEVETNKYEITFKKTADNQNVEIASKLEGTNNENNIETTYTDSKINSIEITTRSISDKKYFQTTTMKPINKPLPTFVPIFRPKKQTRPKKNDIMTRRIPSPEQSNSNFTAIRNSIENNDLIVQYVKNADSKPVLNVFGPQNVIENSNIRIIPLNPMQSNGITVNSFPSNTASPNSLTSNGQIIVPLNEAPHKTGSPNTILEKDIPSRLVPKAVPENAFSLNINPANSLPAGIVTNSVNTVSANVPMSIIPNCAYPINTVLENSALHCATTSPKSLFPANTLTANIAPTSAFPVNTVQQNVILNGMSSNLLPANFVQSNVAAPTAVPRNTVPSTAPRNTVPSNVLPEILNRAPLCNVPQNVQSSHTCPSNVAPLNTNPICAPTGVNTAFSECNKCSDCSKKADLVLFRSENVTVVKVCGDFLKKTTMTVLVPMYVSKLDV